MIIMVLCGVMCSAQNIDREYYEKLSRYVVGYYVKGYVEKKTDANWRSKQDEQFKRIWKEFEDSSINNPIDIRYYDSLWICLKGKTPNNKSTEDVCDKTKAFYNSIKNKFDFKDCNKDRNIDDLISLPDKYYVNWNDNGIPKFQTQHDYLKKELETFYEKKDNQWSEYPEGPTYSDINENSPGNQYSHKEETQTDHSREGRNSGSKNITNEGEKPTRNDAKKVTPKIRISKSNVSKEDSTILLKIKISPSKYEPQNGIKWTVDENVAKVIAKDSTSCTLKFIKKGKTKVTATVDGVKANTTVKFKPNGIGWIFVVIFVLAISYITYLWYRSRKNQHYTNDHNSTNVDNKQSNIKLERRVTELEQMVRELRHDNRLLREDLNRILQKQPELNTFKKTAKRSTDIAHVNNEDLGHSYSYTDEDRTLYADSIIDGYFNKVTEKANDDTTFELHVTKNGANVSVYSDAIRRIIANPSFLDGCDKQIIGNRIVEIKDKGFAQIQMNGKWKLTKRLNVIIK